MNRYFMQFLCFLAGFFLSIELTSDNTSTTSNQNTSTQEQSTQPISNVNCANPSNCKHIIEKVEAKHKIPKNLLSAIATVETRTRPWTVWAKGKGYYFQTKDEAKDFIEQQRKKGTRQMFIGCMQLCMQSHGSKFGSIEDALDPHQNINYAAKLLKKLYRQHGSWEDAVMYYNASSNMEEYRDKVFRIWYEDEEA